ncbi:MAG: hypothetical protein AAGA80_03235 [Cyanobacteria bacterium P01_F01_bin.143]
MVAFGWKEWFDQHGLDITAEDLGAECQKLLPAIRRDLTGLGDFSDSGKRGIEPGKPALSLLYHALASPNVHPTNDGTPHNNPKAYPTLGELDNLENYIYGLARRSLSSFDNPVLAVFAYQYRIAENSPHKIHADLGFSRCGVSRIGTEASRYDAPKRSYTSSPAASERGAAVLPARYGVFIAERRAPTSDDAVFRASPSDNQQIFLFPVHKIFAGDECLLDELGAPITIDSINFSEYHINEKLRRLHIDSPDNPDFIEPLDIFDIDAFPFVRDSNNDPDLVSLESVGDSVLVVSHHHDKLARTATQKVDGTEQLVRFKVPERKEEDGNQISGNRFFSSLSLRAPLGRAAPEYANIRHKFVGNDSTEDLNKTLSATEFQDQVLVKGGYEAAHFIDDSCDGVIAVEVSGLSGLPKACAYSLVTAVDFFPLIRQLDIQRWVEELYNADIGLNLADILRNNRLHFNQGGPRPLSDGRFARSLSVEANLVRRSPNISLKNPLTQASAFPPSDHANFTVTSIIGSAAHGDAFDPADKPCRALSWLPDAAADVFAPGWDISTHIVNGSDTYASYGLGSPFLEDAKLCAALNSYWPAAAPDSSRTFNISGSPTAQPLLDSELGYHPNHPRVRRNEVISNRGWDGEYGPFIEIEGGQEFVNSAHRNRSDYVSNALVGTIGFNGLDQVDAAEMIQRMDVLRLCFGTLTNQTVPNNELWLVNAEKVDDWNQWNSEELPKADSLLSGAGYIYRFAIVDNASVEDVADNPVTRQRYSLQGVVEFQVSAKKLFVQNLDSAWIDIDINIVIE